MTTKPKKHIHNWLVYKVTATDAMRGHIDEFAYFICHCGKAKKVMVEEEKK